MKVVFVSNFYNHHQKPFADELYAQLGDGYRFIETEKIHEERLNMGWGTEEKPPYVLQNYTDSEAKESCQKIIDEADAVIIGSAPRSLLNTRLKNKKLTFYYSERPYKIMPPFYKRFVHLLRNTKNIIRHRNLYILCASAYTSADYAKVLTFWGKAYQWGYFPALKNYDNIDSLINRKNPGSILWVARFIDWKHPEHAVEIAKRLKKDGYEFRLSMIGSGELEDFIRESVKEENLSDCVEMLGTMKPEQVRQHMENSEIFLFTSDRNEGWGAVLNESMNSACAVVANSAIGSVPFLMRHAENGYMYEDGNLDDLYEKVKKLLDDTQERKRLAKNANKTLTEEWNAENAAKKFLVLCERLLHGEYKIFPFQSGVLSKATVLHDNWFKTRKGM